VEEFVLPPWKLGESFKSEGKHRYEEDNRKESTKSTN